MNSASTWENHLEDVISCAIDHISDSEASDIYALSFWVYTNEDDPLLQVIDFNYNTRSQCKNSSDEASSIDEAKWNFAFWLQNEIALIGGEDDPIGAELRAAWLFEGGQELAIQIEDEFWRICARVGKRLHDAGIISSNLVKEQLSINTQNKKFETIRRSPTTQGHCRRNRQTRPGGSLEGAPSFPYP